MTDEYTMLRKLKEKMTYEELAEKIGCHYTTVWRWAHDPECRMLLPYSNAIRRMHNKAVQGELRGSG